MKPLIPIGARAFFGEVPVTVEAISFRDGERIYFALDAHGVMYHCSDGDLVPATDEADAEC